MNDITFNPESTTETGLNKYALLQSAREDIRTKYENILEPTQGSFTTVSDNDSKAKFDIAINQLDVTQEQAEMMNCIKATFVRIETSIDPAKLNFEIANASDGEICIYRRSINGVSNIIINEDGSVAFSFIAFKGSLKNDDYIFFEASDNIDCEKIVLQFFSF